jgi:hypothetical protein
MQTVSYTIAHLMGHQLFNRETRAVKDRLQFSHSHDMDTDLPGNVPC